MRKEAQVYSSEQRRSSFFESYNCNHPAPYINSSRFVSAISNNGLHRACIVGLSSACPSIAVHRNRSGSHMTSHVTFDSICAAARRIKGHVRTTPLQPSTRMGALLGGEIWLKMENMQHTGAYKERGALNKLLSLTPEQRQRGVCAASAGNHAQGLAYHAGRLGIPATIFMPLGTPVIKVTRTAEYGATVKLTGAGFDDSLAACLDHAAASKSTLIHPFDDAQIIAGQGTIGLEMMDQNRHLDTLVIPVGGGGMISGIAKAAREINPKIRIVGVEPAKIPSMARFLAGDTAMQPACTTIAGKNVSCI